MAMLSRKVELRYGIPTSGTQSVMTFGVMPMHLWFAGNLGMKEQPLLIRVPILAEVPEESYWMICIAMELSNLFSSVHMMGSTTTTVGMGKMLV